MGSKVIEICMLNGGVRVMLNKGAYCSVAVLQYIRDILLVIWFWYRHTVDCDKYSISVIL